MEYLNFLALAIGWMILAFVAIGMIVTYVYVVGNLIIRFVKWRKKAAHIQRYGKEEQMIVTHDGLLEYCQ